MKNINSFALKLGNKLSKTLPRSKAFKIAWKSAKQKRSLKKAVCSFAYLNAKGEVREARGTLLPEYLPAPKPQSGKPRNKTSLKITYWDLDKNGFRSFLPENLIN